MALGIAPRLRLPLPAAASSAFHAFVEVHRGLSDHESLYLALPPALLAPYGTTAPIGAVVLLDRKMSGEPGLNQRRGDRGSSISSCRISPGLAPRSPSSTSCTR